MTSRGGRTSKADKNTRPYAPDASFFQLKNTQADKSKTLSIEDVRDAVAATPAETDRFFVLLQESLLLRNLDPNMTNPRKEYKERRLQVTRQTIGMYYPFERFASRFPHFKIFWERFITSCLSHACRKYRTVKNPMQTPDFPPADQSQTFFRRPIYTLRSDTAGRAVTSPGYIMQSDSFDQTHYISPEAESEVTVCDISFAKYTQQVTEDLKLKDDDISTWRLLCPKLVMSFENQREFRTACSIMLCNGDPLWFRYERGPSCRSTSFDLLRSCELIFCAAEAETHPGPRQCCIRNCCFRFRYEQTLQ